MRSRRFYLAALLVTLLLAGVATAYASAQPDGLERVAAEHGIDDQAAEHDRAGAPLADYEVGSIDDDRLSVGVSGVIGVVSVLAIAGGALWALRRRDRPDGADA